MRENFLHLTLDLQRTRGPAGYYRWHVPDLERRWEIIGRQQRDHTGAWEDAAYAEVREASRPLDLERLTADELFAAFPTAIIVGLPGAGKTTMLRHFAWRAFEENPHALVVLVEARHLLPAHVRPARKAEPITLRHIFRVLTTLFLFPGTDPRRLSQEQKRQIDDTALALEQVWDARRAIVLLDALDEAPTPDLQHWLAEAANLLMCALRPPDIAGSRTDIPPGRCYLSLRATELEGPRALAFTEAPVFVVNPLDQEQIRAIARHRLGAGSPLYARFDDLLWRRRDIQKVAGTPLTAMLMVFFYEVHESFARRFATYQLLVLFMLDQAWRRIKTDLFGGPRQGLNPFFHEVLHDRFLADRPVLDLQYQALAYAARRFLYHRRAGSQSDTERAMHRDELHELLKGWLARQETVWLKTYREPLPSDADPERWLAAWAQENILLPSGPDRVVFLHSAVLEFLAAVGLADLLARAATAEDDLSRMFDERSRDHLETLPILCSADHTTAWRVLARLAPQCTAISPESTLPLRCLAETEAAEMAYLERYQDESLHADKAQEVDSHAEKDWAYQHLHSWVLGPPDAQEAQRFAWLEARLADLEGAIPLCRPALMTRYLPDWRNDGTPVARKQEELRRRMLDDLVWQQVTGGATAIPSLEDMVSAESHALVRRYLDILHRYRGPDFVRRVEVERTRLTRVSRRPDHVLDLDLPEHPEDRNLAYYCATCAPALLGFYGSPNFCHGDIVNALAFSPGGQLAISASDQRLILWEVASGREIRRFVGHRSSIQACAFSPDGRWVLSGAWDETLKLWEASTGQEIRTFTGHRSSIQACAFSPDGRWVLSGAWDETLKLWEASTGQEVGSWEVGCLVYAVSFHPVTPLLVVAALQNGTLALLDLRQPANGTLRL